MVAQMTPRELIDLYVHQAGSMRGLYQPPGMPDPLPEPTTSPHATSETKGGTGGNPGDADSGEAP